MPQFEKQGIALAAISYDSEAILRYFADRCGIGFPLLADSDSKAIRAYQVLNTEAVGGTKGMARPGYFFIDTEGVIREKFFDANYRDRVSGSSMFSKLFAELSSEVTDVVEAPHFRLNLEQSDRSGTPGSRITLTAEVLLPPDVHVYAPGSHDYKPINLVIDPQPDIELRPVTFPRSRILYLSAINESVPVFEGAFRVNQDIRVSSVATFISSLGKDGKTLTIRGHLQYQACDTKTCFLPASVPVQWQLRILPFDRQRAPENIQHK